MKYPTIPALSAPRSAWDRILAPLFDTVDRALNRAKARENHKKPAITVKNREELPELIEKGA